MLIKKTKHLYLTKEFKFRAVALGIIFLLIGYSIGVEKSKFQELNWCVEQGIKMLKIQGYEVNLNGALITAGIRQYRERFQTIINETRP